MSTFLFFLFASSFLAPRWPLAPGSCQDPGYTIHKTQGTLDILGIGGPGLALRGARGDGKKSNWELALFLQPEVRRKAFLTKVTCICRSIKKGCR
jgi:hypothetical protein